ncbi:hypothetical protein DEU56DRAFT_563559 [Suillus clintonianus]|uniref:uncharacterized protein n=1 Tax=Suillus clintonianus TaxID=1904413 RepID=UPI001B87CB4E|nr:uncharacterized protein DEU56DRAFT_563559 [Suillus clintonianus]KAG2125722.1 hypothetical protein DEU56DRAFT_563559 [Suillus clintonianus]
MSATNGNYPAIQSLKTWFVSWKARSKNLSGYAIDGSSSTGTCYMLHGVLIIIHFVLVIFYIFHWEHRATFPFTPMNNDFWPVVLSASLQAFYTMYTAVLLFLTQRLAMSRTLIRRLKLTTIHDISGAWSGLGSALSSIWQQIDISASWWAISAVTAYLASISVLHVTSSTLLQFQTFNTSMATSVPTTLGWPNDTMILGDFNTNWGSITASLPVVNQLPGLVSVGLSNTTVYDTPQTSSMAGHATVNATTISSRCGLLPNVTYSADAGMLNVNSSLDDGFGTYLNMGASYPWSDQVQALVPGWSFPSNNFTGPGTNPGVVLMVSTLLDIEPSVQQEVAVPTTWELPDHSNYSVVDQYVVDVYFVQCSLSAATAEAVLDMQTNSLQNPVTVSQPSTQWEIKQWPQWTSNTWQTAIGWALAYQVGSGYSFITSAGFFAGNPASEPSIADEYIMSSVGLNLAAEDLVRATGGHPLSTVVLSPGQLEAAIAQVTAQLIWTAGRIGTSNGGLQYGNGMAYVDEQIIALRLNINLLPLLFATSASVMMMILALYMTRAFDASSGSQAAVPNTGALQLLWLGRHSAPINEVLDDVEHPTEANLRRAGMIDVCFAKTMSDESEELRGSTDTLSFRNRNRHYDRTSDWV